MAEFGFSQHAEEEARRRAIPLELAQTVLRHPQQVVKGYGGKTVYQSQLDFGGGKIHLLRAIVDENADPPIVVTVYKTSKVEKYWSKP